MRDVVVKVVEIISLCAMALLCSSFFPDCSDRFVLYDAFSYRKRYFMDTEMMCNSF